MVSETTWYKNVSLDVNNKCFDVNFKLDTEAEVNILPLYILSMFKVIPKLSKTNISLTTYGNFNLKPNGSLIINCFTDKLKNVPLPFYVVNVKSKPILRLTGYNVVPVIHPPRRVPLALQPKLKCTLDRLKKEGIVSKVNKQTDWVQSLVIVEKPNGNLRLCLDPRDLNKVIKREHYQIPCTDDIISRLESEKIFSVVDLKDGFWHVPLDEVSFEICTVNTPFGRYKFNKRAFGIFSAPEACQKRNQKLFGDIEGVDLF
ncbi:transposon Ty3-I Gag-Pol polyprotein [Trichonephila clavipes]|nr:transposon Ty3-I Gag-Pol polyprotein [Trichonephila clavipes]